MEAPLDIHPVIVGTGPDCTIVVPDSRVSRRHCELRLSAEGILLRDLGSKNGTMLGQAAILEARIPPRVSVMIGDSELVVQPAGAPRVVPMSPTGVFGGAIGRSFAMRALFAKLERAAATDQTILLLGESGTGKEVLARSIHDHSPRKKGPFVVFDCGATSANLVESELFGHTRGAFTGAQTAQTGLLEEASGGTLFIDEIGELPLDLQPKLLRALEARQIRRLGATEFRPFDARIVAATHKNLRARAAEGQFREDLYYRLAVVEVLVPALRERKEDIPALVDRFLAAHDPPRSPADLPANALALLAGHDWPGNVRELRNVVARLLLFPETVEEMLRPLKKEAPATLPPAAEAPVPRAAAGADRLDPLLEMPLLDAREMVMEQFERSYLTTWLNRHKGNISRAAEAMGVSRQLVHKLLDKHGIRPKGAF